LRFAAIKILALLFDPGCLLVLVGLAGLPGAWRGRRAGLWLVSLALGGLAVILLLPLHQWLLLPLENRFPPPRITPAQVAGIILIGGAQEVELSEARGVASFNDTMETLSSFVALARRYPDAVLAFSGGSGAIAGTLISEAAVSRAMFEQLGLERRVIYEDASRDTYENAVLLKKIVRPAPGGLWLLVTAASHMPRSVGCFEAAGWPVVAWPVAYKSAGTAAVALRHPTLGDHLTTLDMALHEWVGLAVYWLQGRTRVLFPQPR
jgi:uncharacterized SAM-binding protein YcdF (DUF218 family)